MRKNVTTPIHPNDKSLGILGRYYKMKPDKRKNRVCKRCGALCYGRHYCRKCMGKSQRAYTWKKIVKTK